LSIRNGVLLNNQLIYSVMDDGCLVLRSAAHNNIRKLQVLQPKCLHTATVAPWYVGSREIHQGFGVPLSPTTSGH